jgi:death-on-curing protein
VNPRFLTLDQVLALHDDQVALYGGSSGIRDLGLLQSAIGTVSATFGGVFLHETIFEMAAAYLFHVSRNHPFLDGNKRTGLAAALTFLDMNDVEIAADDNELFDLALGVAESRVSKAEVAVFFQQHS